MAQRTEEHKRQHYDNGLPEHQAVLDDIERVARLLRTSRSVLFITGAGISADSGLPTYRGRGGIYDGCTTEDGIPIESALSADTFRKRPEVTWKYIARIESASRGRTPNRAHEVIAEMEPLFDRVCVLTQNVDGFHAAAGSTNVIPIHGNLHDLHCTRCSYRTRVPDYSGLELPPSCPSCGAVIRPGVVLFGEQLPASEVERLLHELERGFDIVFSVGTTSVFPYIAQPVMQARARGIPTVEINPETTVLTDVFDFHIAERAAVALDELWRRYRAGRLPDTKGN